MKVFLILYFRPLFYLNLLLHWVIVWSIGLLIAIWVLLFYSWGQCIFGHKDLRIPIKEPLKPPLTSLEGLILTKLPGPLLYKLPRNISPIPNHIPNKTDHLPFQLLIRDFPAGPSLPLASLLPSAKVINGDVEMTGDLACWGLEG